MKIGLRHHLLVETKRMFKIYIYCFWKYVPMQQPLANNYLRPSTFPTKALCSSNTPTELTELISSTRCQLTGNRTRVKKWHVSCSVWPSKWKVSSAGWKIHLCSWSLFNFTANDLANFLWSFGRLLEQRGRHWAGHWRYNLISVLNLCHTQFCRWTL